jgi:glyoxylase-like metal-dependent hydrolase (beta-lactamase superfamily II)
MLQGTTIAVPTVSFTDKARVDLGGIAVELLAAAPSHTPGSALVWVPSRRVLFTGDVLFTDFHPYLAEGDLPGWLKALDPSLTAATNTAPETRDTAASCTEGRFEACA